jgi:osmotically-inducible protein OsmY
MAMQSDLVLRESLEEVLDAIPSVNGADIEVLVDKGWVTLNGKVDTHQTRFHVERAARRVPGVRGLQINIRPVRR